MSFAATWMDLEIIMPSEITQRKTNIICNHLHVESLKKDTDELIYKTERDSQTSKINLRLSRQTGGGEGWIGGLGLAYAHYCIWSRYSIGNSTQYCQYSPTAYMGQEPEREQICIHT